MTLKKKKERKNISILVFIVVIVAVSVVFYFNWRDREIEKGAKQENTTDEDSSQETGNFLKDLEKKSKEKTLETGELSPRNSLFLEPDEFVILYSKEDYTLTQVLKRENIQNFYLSNIMKEKNVTGADLDPNNNKLVYSSREFVKESDEEEKKEYGGGGLYLTDIKENKRTFLAPNDGEKLYYQNVLFSPDFSSLAVEIIDQSKKELALYDFKLKEFRRIRKENNESLVIKEFTWSDDNRLIVVGENDSENRGVYLSTSLEKRHEVKKILPTYFGDKLIPMIAIKSPSENTLAVLILETNEKDEKSPKILMIDLALGKEIKKIDLPFGEKDDLKIVYAFKGEGINLTANGDLYFISEKENWSLNSKVIKEGVGDIIEAVDDGILIFESKYTSKDNNSLTNIIIYDIIKNNKIFESEVSKFVKLIGIT